MNESASVRLSVCVCRCVVCCVCMTNGLAASALAKGVSVSVSLYVLRGGEAGYSAGKHVNYLQQCRSQTMPAMLAACLPRIKLPESVLKFFKSSRFECAQLTRCMASCGKEAATYDPIIINAAL